MSPGHPIWFLGEFTTVHARDLNQKPGSSDHPGGSSFREDLNLSK